MLIDARTLPDGSEINADLIIVGGGMAGITLAREWIGAGRRVAILEAGDVEYDDDAQALYEGEAVLSGPDNKDRDHSPYMTASRVRFFGGSGNAWGGKCVPLDAADFMERDWVEHSGWPITRADLQPYYDRASDMLEIPRFDRDFDQPQEEGRPPFRANGAQHFSSLPRHFTKFSGAVDPDAYDSFKNSITDQPNIDVYLNANVTDIVVGSETRPVTHLEVRTLSGKRHVARGETYVLATGGIENIRLLLASNSVRKAGVGNENDLVGRYWQGHANMGMYSGATGTNSSMYLSTTTQSMALYTDSSRDKVHAVLGLNVAGQTRYRVPNFTITMHDTWYKSQAAGRAAHQLAGLLDRGVDTEGGQHIQIYFKSEHVPNPESRLTLSDDVDALGMPKVKMDWRFSARDWASYGDGISALRQELGEHGLGRVEWPLEPSEYLPEMSTARHHMGATRMHVDPDKGVVNADCRLHSVDNLYIAGSSVFPTSGNANPTLTILALVNRLSDHLKSIMGVV